MIIIVFLLFVFTAQSINITIDPGHGGKFLGAISCNQKLVEKDLTLEIAKKLSTKFALLNFINVNLIRNEDKHFKDDLHEDLIFRSEYAKQNNADIFISIHFNFSFRSKSVRFFEIYVPMKDVIDIDSYKLAMHLHDSFSKNIEPIFEGNLGNLNIKDGGIRAAKFNVLMNASCPAVLLELDYISNEDSESLLLTEKYKDNLVQAIFNGILAYCFANKINF